MSDPITVAEMPNRNKNIQFRSVLKSLSPNMGAQMLWYSRERGGDMITLAQGESDVGTPSFICEAAAKAMHDGKTTYGPVLGQMELRQEISNYYAHIYGVNLPTNRIFVTGSGTTAMHLSLTSLLDEGDDVVAVTPIWKNLLGAVELAQANIIQVPLEDDGDKWNLDLQKLFDSVTPKTKALLIVSPSNPTGWIMSKAQMKQVIEFARERDIWIISDEVYNRITYNVDRAPSFLDVATPEDKLYIVGSFSKSYSMTGWRLGWLIGPPQAEEAIRDIALYDNMGPTTFNQFGGVEALRHGEPFIKEQRKLWQSNLDLLFERFEQNGRIRMSKPDATFYAFFKVDGEPDCIALARRLIDEGGLSLAPGCAFGKCCKGYIRMCFGVSEPKLIEALDRLDRVLGK